MDGDRYNSSVGANAFYDKFTLFDWKRWVLLTLKRWIETQNKENEKGIKVREERKNKIK